MSLVLPNTRGVTLLAIASLASTLGLGACGGRVEGSSTSEIHSEPGPTPSEPDSVVVEPAPGPRALEGTHVVVRSGARFFPSAEAKEPVVTRSFLSDEAAPPGTLAARTIGWVMAAGELHGSRVEVRSLGGEDDSSSCGHNFAGLDDMEVRMWVERSDLVVVTTGFVEATYADGSGLSIPPGAPIVPDSPLPEGLDGADEPGPWLATWGFERSLAKAEFAEDGPLVTGQAFVPAERPPLANLAEPEGHLLLDGREFWAWSAKQGARVERDGAVFYVLRESCVDIRVRSVEEVPEGAEGGLGLIGTGRGGGGYSPSDQRALVSVPEGATVYWPDGSAAGVTRRELRANRVVARGEGRCAYFGVGNESRDLVLCFDPEQSKVLELGHVVAKDPKWKPAPEDLDGANRRLDAWLQRLRVPCISRAIEADPTLDASMTVRLRVDKPSKESGTGPNWTTVAVEGKPRSVSPELRSCVEAELGKWRPRDYVGKQVRVELRMSAAQP
ncbi:hypothetical protein PPSIR1_05673 [Plesiocystis pacifica SIR-1]|uniref:Uncharacterized protein n=1 Tax=Plesiocystis pacifica SIR-1 TaxID=391625 RepID=A6FXA7_9BACT|nr:hypothetical protein [Plesiocystis pacifica]EDM81931.1 hypothetical protein PPSIR1_05673 [Plesiocystis pacifica SIR-1]